MISRHLTKPFTALVSYSVGLITMFLLAQSCPAQVINDPQVNELRSGIKDIYELYERQLQSVLRTRLQEEEEFVTKIVDLVRTEKLPKNVVDRAWLWVRSNRNASRYPFVYFERVLRLQTAKLDVEIPEFDRAIYSRIRRNSLTRRRR